MEEKLLQSIIQSCKTPKQLRQIQSQIIVSAIEPQNHLISSRFLARCSELKQIDFAQQVFDQLPDRRYTSLWNVMSKGYLQNERYSVVLTLFNDMIRENVKINCYTLPVILKSCCKLSALIEGEEVHCIAVKSGFKSNTYVGTNLIELYSRKGRAGCAYRVFTEMVFRNVVTWTAMVNGYVSNGDLVSARRLFDLAPERDIVLWNRMVTGYAEGGDMVEARKLFDVIPDKDVIACNTLLNGYARNGDMEGCERLFETMKERNIFSWNGMIGGYAHNGRFEEVISMFKRMLEEASVQPNDATLVNVLSACARLGALDFGKWVRMYAERNKYLQNIYVCNGLIDMYSKCGVVECAIEVFESMQRKDLISWNSIINALAVHGHGPDALRLFNEMKTFYGEKPDGVTFIGILCACSHMGLVQDGLDYFQSMSREYSIEPRIEHYGCVVDLLGRNGLLEQAMEFIDNMPVKVDSVIWTALLAAARVHKKIEYAEATLQKLIELDPGNPANYVMLSNVYGEAQKWGELARLKVAMRDTGAKKVPGWSSIQTVDGVEEFYAFDERHEKRGEIYDALNGLTMLLRILVCESDFVEFG